MRSLSELTTVVDQIMHAQTNPNADRPSSPITINGERHNIVIHANAPVFIVGFDETVVRTSQPGPIDPDLDEPRKRP